jgi:hypothetical protein
MCSQKIINKDRVFMLKRKIISEIEGGPNRSLSSQRTASLSSIIQSLCGNFENEAKQEHHFYACIDCK